MKSEKSRMIIDFTKDLFIVDISYQELKYDFEDDGKYYKNEYRIWKMRVVNLKNQNKTTI
ncbi:MAG: hypothetical protein WAN84_02900 [Acutalibacteraceae bacterium]|jgi:hypothetical protein|nr:hypothetical protein [Clostridiales bacterium]